MRRIELPARAAWQRSADGLGFVYHTYSGGPYWSEDACYVLERSALEAELRPAMAELWRLSLAVVDHACGDDRVLASLGIPEAAWDLVRASWRRRDPAICTRFDLAWDGGAPPKLHECNGDTPGTLFEAAIFQWLWLEDRLAAAAVPADADQFNRLHAALVAAFARLPAAAPVHFAASRRNLEDGLWTRYLADCAAQAGMATAFVDLEDIGVDRSGRLCDAADRRIEWLVKAYRWELLLREPFGPHLLQADQARLVEPAWKLILSSKGLLVWLWRLFPGHPNLLPCWLAGDTGAPADRVVVKPLFSRNGHNVLLRDPSLPGGQIRTGGTYGREGHVVQALHRLPVFTHRGSERHAAVGGWIVDGEPAGLGILEGDGPIIHDATNYFAPHIVIP